MRKALILERLHMVLERFADPRRDILFTLLLWRSVLAHQLVADIAAALEVVALCVGQSGVPLCWVEPPSDDNSSSFNPFSDIFVVPQSSLRSHPETRRAASSSAGTVGLQRRNAAAQRAQLVIHRLDVRGREAACGRR
jgi:hypothetical protein